MKSILALAISVLAGAVVHAETPISLTTQFDPFVTQASAVSNEISLNDYVEVAQRRRVPSPWSFSFTQTSDYGTSLALPIGLTPANTLLAPAGNPGQANILTGPQAAVLGVLGNLGLAPVPPGGANVVGVFEDDFQFQTTAYTQYQRKFGEFVTFTGGYNYYQNLHPDVKQLDLMSHTPSAQLALQLTDRIVSTNYYNYNYYFLNGDSFVTQNRVGNTTTFLANNRWDLALGANYANANFRQSADYLNSDNYAGTLEATRYLGGARNNYFKVGYGAGYSDAQLSGFSYQVNNFYTVTRFLYGDGNRNEVRLTGGYGRYDFIGVDPLQAGIYRADNIYTSGLFYGRRLSTNLQLFASYNYLKSNSNVIRQLYNSDLFSFGVTYAR